MKYKCPCCGNYTLPKEANGTFEICPVCFWEDDPVQLDNENYAGGANDVSLVQGRINYQKFGTCQEDMISHVRKPNVDEIS